MNSGPDKLLAESVQELLRTKWLGKRCHCFGSVSSTMDVIKRLADAGAEVGTLIVADTQTQGRGQGANKWHSMSGMGIWCSMLLPAGLAAGVVPHIVAASVRAALEAAGVPNVGVKWPNDVVVCGSSTDESGGLRKIAGILAERGSVCDECYRVGIGVNVHHRAGDFPDELAGISSSVYQQTGRSVPRRDLLVGILEEIESRVDRAGSGLDAELDGLAREWRRHSVVIGREIVLIEGSHVERCRAVDVRADGALIVGSDGNIRAVRSGSVRLIGNACAQ